MNATTNTNPRQISRIISSQETLTDTNNIDVRNRGSRKYFLMTFSVIIARREGKKEGESEGSVRERGGGGRKRKREGSGISVKCTNTGRVPH